MTIFRFLLLAALTALGASCASTSPQPGKGVVVEESAKGARITVDGELFTEYICRDISRPALYPLLGPGQASMTRAYPFETPEGEEHDHPHHRGVFFAHGALNGHDFWSEVPKAGKTVHQGFLELRSGRDAGVLRSSNHLVSAEGKLIATDARTLRFYRTKAGKMLDYEVTVFASPGELTFGDTKEGTMAIRVAETLRVMRNKKPADGHIVLSTGARDGEAWGQRAEWCDYHGPVQGKTVGLAVFDNPANPRHPTWWHVRDYGLLAANPFGVHDFEKQPEGAGNLVLPAGQSITFKYRIYLHEGDEKEGQVASAYQAYAGQPPMR